MTRAIAKPKEQWRHYKGKEYWVIAIAYHQSPDDQYVIYCKLPHAVKDVLGKPIYDTERDRVFHAQPGTPISNLLALKVINYPIAHSNVPETIWARPLANFMGVVSGKSGECDRASDWYRFTKIGDRRH